MILGPILGLIFGLIGSRKGNYRFEAAGTTRGFLAFISVLIATDLGYP